ncbi:MAG: peptidoglycan bridge formation glycyltransferase FemA/FemB family protein [Candidatus Chisholmbacteria bacterium]|nr:peptidoglycan bridge formation glycyltransferase FemA/FemB family protein [Candidatus Chisholmbacteria bacterium]
MTQSMIEVKEITVKDEWEQAVSRFPEANFLQSWNWGQFHQNLDQSVHRLGYFKGDTLQGVMLAIVERAKRATYLTVPGGPLLDWHDKDVVNSWKETIINLAQDHRASFIRVRPQLLDTPENASLFKSLGFRSSPMHLHAELTHQIDLAKSEADLLTAMRKTTRYEITQSEKIGLKVSTSQNPKDMGVFYDLQLETAKRQSFVPFGKKFLEEQFRIFALDNQATLYAVTLKGRLLVQAIIMFYALEADYHYSASSEESRQYPAAYALQWRAIRDAKARGFKRYNLWGVAPEGDTNHRFHGVSVFKRGFRGEDVAYLHARDLVINPFRYAINYGIESIRRRLRRV